MPLKRKPLAGTNALGKMRLLQLVLLTATLPNAALCAQEADTCAVLRSALRVTTGFLTGVHVLRGAQEPWPYFGQLSPVDKRRLLSRISSSLGVEDSIIAQLAVARGALPTCYHDDRLTWVFAMPSQSDTSTALLSVPVFIDSARALAYVGWSNRWVGNGTIYLVTRLNRTWRVTDSALAWVQ